MDDSVFSEFLREKHTSWFSYLPRHGFGRSLSIWHLISLVKFYFLLFSAHLYHSLAFVMDHLSPLERKIGTVSEKITHAWRTPSECICLWYLPTALGGQHQNPHFTDAYTETPKHYASHPRSHREWIPACSTPMTHLKCPNLWAVFMTANNLSTLGTLCPSANEIHLHLWVA